MESRKTDSKSKEFIIPIHMEGQDENVEEMKQNQRTQQLKAKSTERIIPIERDSVSQPKEVVPESSISQENQCEEDTEAASTSKNPISNMPFKRNLPFANSKEKIVIIVDSAEDDHCSPFKVNNNLIKPLDMIKRGVEIFLNLKHRSSEKDEYALVILNENNALWLLDFTSNISDVINLLENVSPCQTEDVFDLDSLFDVILQNVSVPAVCKVEEVLIPPPYVVRSVLFYARSYTLPKISNSEEIKKLLNSPYYTFDVVMTHEPFDTDNNCNEIANILQNVDKKGFAYFFPTIRNSKVLFESVGKLLGHPLQRPVQTVANYSLKHYIDRQN